MKVSVQVKPNSRREGVEVMTDESYLIRVNAPPVDGKANERVIELLSQTLKIPKSSVVLLKGSKGKKKVFEVLV